MGQPTTLRPLGKLMNLIEGLGYTLEYQYEDLVFVNHTAFLFCFDGQDPNKILVHFNIDCEETLKTGISGQLQQLAKKEGLKLNISSSYEIKSKEGKEEVQIIFKD